MPIAEREKIAEALRQAKKREAAAEAKAAGLFEQLEAAENTVQTHMDEVRRLQRQYDEAWR